MPYDRTLHIPAREALAAFVRSGVLTGAIVRHAESLVERWTDAGDDAGRAFATTDEQTRLAISNRIDYAPKDDHLHVKEHGLEEAIAALAPIAISATAEMDKITTAIAKRRKEGREPSLDDLARLEAAFASEQEASILLSLATGARILTLTVADRCALELDDPTAA